MPRVDKPHSEPVSADEWCVRVTRHGAAGLEEDEGKIEVHRTNEETVVDLLEVVRRTIGPGDRAEITLWRGVPDHTVRRG